MSSSQSASQPDSASVVSDTLTPPAETVRACADRERRLTEYIRAHTGEDIAVRLTPHVPTACVMPTSEESLVESDNAEFSAEQAEQLVESVDADYLVLISTQPATVDNLPISDQLTADRAQQFGYALHELGHVRYTAIADAATLLEERIDEEYQEFVHGLWNSCEDAAIEGQLALDQSQLAADRLELVNRSISPRADAFPADDCYEYTFRDAIDTALYDTGIYDTGIRDVLCDPDDDRFVFASDADQQAFEHVADSIDGLIGTVLRTLNSVDRAEHVLDWWETTIKPLLDPSEQQQQESEQPDPARAGGESSADGRSNSNDDSSGSSSTGSSDGCGTDQSTDESADTDRSSSESEATQDGEGTLDSSNSAANPEDAERDTSATADEPDERGETDGPAGSQSETRPDPDAINTDQRQSSPGTDVLDYPDIGGDEDATALQQPQSTNENEAEPESESTSESDGKDEREGESEPQSSGDSTENAQTADTRTETGAGSVDDSGSSDESLDRDNVDSSARADTDGRSVGEGEDGETADANDDTTSRAEASPDGEEQSDQQTTGSENRGDGNGTDEATETPAQGNESRADGPPEESHSPQNPWRADDSTDQSTLGSFSTAETSPSENDVNASNDGRSGESDETSTTTPDSERDDPSTDGSDVGESESESELEAEAGESGTEDGSNDTTPADTGAGTDADAEIDRNENTTHEKGGASDTRPSDGSSNDDSISAAREQRGDTSDETQSEADEQPTVSTPVHADEEESLDRDGALDTDRDAAHDEADRATPDEQALECELADVADALDALTEQDGGGVAPGSLSELTIMPDVGGSSIATTVERWGEAAVDAEFVADTLRKALKENRQDARRSGVTSGTFDRQRAGALARGDVGAFCVRQPGDDKQYDLVMILDRSGSMRKHIGTAEDALVRFALSCEDIGINVGVIDFLDDEARLVKPFSVGCEHVRGSFLSSQYGGNTPLADALGLGRELLEQRRNSPLVLVVTDGKPGDEGAYHDEIAQSYAPICGLTLVLDKPSGCVPDRVARNEQFYDRHVYVHDSNKLADRLDQFAVMFDGF